jgi:hypothetical protein
MFSVPACLYPHGGHVQTEIHRAEERILRRGGWQTETYVDGRGVELPPHQQQVVGVRRPAAAVARLDLHEGLEPAQGGRRLAPHRLPPDQRLQPHQALERAQRTPSLETVCLSANHTASLH